MKSHIAVLLVALAFGNEIAHAASTYSVINLGTLGRSRGTVATDINNSGQVVGHSRNADDLDRAFLYGTGGMIDLGILGGAPNSSALGINDLGQVVGISGTGFLFSGNAMTAIGGFAGGGTRPLGINNSGQVVGDATAPPDDVFRLNRVFLFNGGVTSNVGAIIGTGFAINDGGQIVGSASFSDSPLAPGNAFIYSAGVFTNIGTLGGKESIALGINNIGQVVGQAETAGSLSTHAFLYSAGNKFDLGTLGGKNSSAEDINDLGQIVGSADTTIPSPNNGGQTNRHAFLFSGGIMVDLNSLVDPGWSISGAVGINNIGQIAANGCNTISGECGALLLSLTAPVPEPKTYAMLLAGFGLIGIAAMRRKPRIIQLS